MQHRRELLQAGLENILPSSAPLTVELGCGHGHFLTAYAKANPTRICIGIDIVRERIERALRKRDRAQLVNLHFIHTEGNLFFEAVPAGTRFSELFILFPDPWPKSRHHKNRIIQRAFLSVAARHMNHEGLLCFRTDYRPYFENALRLIGEHPHWKLTTEAWPFEFTTVFQSRAPQYHSLTARRSAEQSSHKTDGDNSRSP
jgi:tRNA (guanine-N7-)-methyltransferase